jgi:RNA polymerase sigma-70 factor (ECF subfamily)
MPAVKFELLDPDVRLMLSVRDGNAAAFEALVHKYQNRLITILQHLVNDRSLAEDLAQEVFMRIYRARLTYVPTAKFSTWLYTITNNVANNAIRKSSRRKEVNLVSSPSGTMKVRPLDTMAKDKSALMPTRQLDQREMSRILHDAIQSLSPRQRMAMMLSRFENLSYIEIAEAMQLSTQAVKSLLSRARVNLKELLEPYLEAGHLPQTDSPQSRSSGDDEEDSR